VARCKRGHRGDESLKVRREFGAGWLGRAGQFLSQWQQVEQGIGCMPLVERIRRDRGEHADWHSQAGQFGIGQASQRLARQQCVDAYSVSSSNGTAILNG
jgi:hypothetical protein